MTTYQNEKRSYGSLAANGNDADRDIFDDDYLVELALNGPTTEEVHALSNIEQESLERIQANIRACRDLNLRTWNDDINAPW